MSPPRILSRPSLVHACLDWLFTQVIATAMTCAPERRPAKPVQRQHPGHWCNIRVSGDTIFGFNAIQISDNTGRILSGLASALASHEGVRIAVIGHTDSSGEPDYNVYVSQLRAQAVAGYLIEKGLPEEYTQSEGRVDHDTRSEDSTRDRPELRHRVDIYISPLQTQ